MNKKMIHIATADTLLLIHLLFVAFLVLGLPAILSGKLFHWAWVRNPWFRAIHLAGIGVVAVQSWLGITCPLTVWESVFRQKAGETVYIGTFMSHWIEFLLYYQAPQWVFTGVYTIFTVAVLGCWVWVRPDPFSKS